MARRCEFTIPAGQTQSQFIQFGTDQLVGLYTPAALTGTSFSFLAKDRPEDAGVPVSGAAVAVTAGGFFGFAQSMPFYGVKFLAIVSNATEDTVSITDAADNGSGLIRITATAHGLIDGDTIAISGVLGTTEANGTWQVDVIDANTFDLVNSAFVNAYVSGGIVTKTGELANRTIIGVAEEN